MLKYKIPQIVTLIRILLQFAVWIKRKTADND